MSRNMRSVSSNTIAGIEKSQAGVPIIMLPLFVHIPSYVFVERSQFGQ